ncbi:MAG: NAD(P)-dependent oxidoreductase [Planctomycetota bacterium]|nr:NAD(P)-dependent oxidoreductase [Planctomycetota bacterium]MDA1142417.1 NAD(P)-dependent oxidoreductase [Planctomycetota bacterium]
MKILLAGATGFLGSNLVPVLLREGHEVTAVSRSERKGAVESMGCRFVASDLADSGPAPLCGDHDVAIFLALSSNHHGWPDKSYDVIGVNVLGAAKFAEAARKAGVRRLLHASSGSVYWPADEAIKEDAPLRSDNLYSLSQKTGEDFVRLYEQYFDVIVFRVFYLYGPGQSGRLIPNIVQKVADGTPIDLQPRAADEKETDGLVVSVTYVENAVQILNSLMHSSFKGTVNFAGPETISIRRLAETASEILGKQPVFKISNEPRAGNMIADTTLLQNIVSLSSEPFESCLGKVIQHG